MDLSNHKSFEQFVMEQSPTAPINHKCGWYTCAVGDYMDVVMNCREMANSSNQNQITEILDDDALEASLNANGRPVGYDSFYEEYTADGDDDVVLNTYGDLQKYYRGELDITFNWEDR